jgi:hypothetical protein
VPQVPSGAHRGSDDPGVAAPDEPPGDAVRVTRGARQVAPGERRSAGRVGVAAAIELEQLSVGRAGRLAFARPGLFPGTIGRLRVVRGRVTGLQRVQ